jgi:hypothetical protein
MERGVLNLDVIVVVVTIFIALIGMVMVISPIIGEPIVIDDENGKNYEDDIGDPDCENVEFECQGDKLNIVQCELPMCGGYGYCCLGNCIEHGNDWCFDQYNDKKNACNQIYNELGGECLDARDECLDGCPLPFGFCAYQCYQAYNQCKESVIEGYKFCICSADYFLFRCNGDICADPGWVNECVGDWDVPVWPIPYPSQE